jgi:hypothetical protein
LEGYYRIREIEDVLGANIIQDVRRKPLMKKKMKTVKCYENIFIREHFHLCGVNDKYVFTIQRFIVN